MNDFFTLDSMLTLTGATGATFVVTNGLKQAFNLAPKWLGLVVAQAICLTGAYYAGKSGSDYVVAAINGFLVFCSAAGVTGVGNAAVNGKVDPAAARSGNVARDDARQIVRKKGFFTPWF